MAPTGAVNIFANGNNELGSAQLDGNGNYTFSFTPQSAGTIPLSAKYVGDSGNNPSLSPTVQEPVNSPVQNTATSINVAPNPGTVGQPITVSGSVTQTP